MKCKTCGTDHRGVAKHGGYCLDHQERRAEAAEVAVAESAAFARGLQNELKSAESRIQELKALLESITTVELHNAMQQRNEARRQLSEAQTAIDVLSKTVVAQDAEIKRLRQQREDVEQYRAEIERLTRKAMTTPPHIQEALNEGDGAYRP